MFNFLASVLDFGKTIFGWMKEKSAAKHDLNMAALESRQAIIQSNNAANTA